MIVPPRIVSELSWVGNYWPSDIPTEDVQFVRPEVQRYCLMGAAGSYTDFHVDFGGSSVWYHVLRVCIHIRFLDCSSYFVVGTRNFQIVSLLPVFL